MPPLIWRSEMQFLIQVYLLSHARTFCMQSVSGNASRQCFKDGTLLILDELVNFERKMGDQQLQRLQYNTIKQKNVDDRFTPTAKRDLSCQLHSSWEWLVSCHHEKAVFSSTKKIPSPLCKVTGIKDRIPSVKFSSPSEQASPSASVNNSSPRTKLWQQSSWKIRALSTSKHHVLASFHLLCKTRGSKDVHEFSPKPESLLHLCPWSWVSNLIAFCLNLDISHTSVTRWPVNPSRTWLLA